MDLHRSEKVPDWELIKAEKRNRWQKIAAKTRGVITPANLVTVGAAGLFMNGLYEYSQGQKTSGFLKMMTGAVGDWVDGKVAARTGTKSPLGEALDAGLDKVKMFGALIVLGVTDVVPVVPIAVVGAQNATNAVLTGIAKARKHEVHTEVANKLTPWAQGIGLGSFVVADMVSPGTGQQIAETVGYVGTVIGTATVGALGTKNLYDCAFNPQQQSEAA